MFDRGPRAKAERQVARAGRAESFRRCSSAVRGATTVIEGSLERSRRALVNAIGSASPAASVRRRPSEKRPNRVGMPFPSKFGSALRALSNEPGYRSPAAPVRRQSPANVRKMDLRREAVRRRSAERGRRRRCRWTALAARFRTSPRRASQLAAFAGGGVSKFDYFTVFRPVLPGHADGLGRRSRSRSRGRDCRLQARPGTAFCYSAFARYGRPNLGVFSIFRRLQPGAPTG